MAAAPPPLRTLRRSHSSLSTEPDDSDFEFDSGELTTDESPPSPKLYAFLPSWEHSVVSPALSSASPAHCATVFKAHTADTLLTRATNCQQAERPASIKYRHNPPDDKTDHRRPILPGNEDSIIMSSERRPEHPNTIARSKKELTLGSSLLDRRNALNLTLQMGARKVIPRERPVRASQGGPPSSNLESSAQELSSWRQTSFDDCNKRSKWTFRLSFLHRKSAGHSSELLDCFRAIHHATENISIASCRDVTISPQGSTARAAALHPPMTAQLGEHWHLTPPTSPLRNERKSPHAQHYEQQRVRDQLSRKRTFLPYRQSLLALPTLIPSY